MNDIFEKIDEAMEIVTECMAYEKQISISASLLIKTALEHLYNAANLIELEVRNVRLDEYKKIENKKARGKNDQTND